MRMRAGKKIRSRLNRILQFIQHFSNVGRLVNTRSPKKEAIRPILNQFTTLNTEQTGKFYIKNLSINQTLIEFDANEVNILCVNRLYLPA